MSEEKDNVVQMPGALNDLEAIKRAFPREFQGAKTILILIKDDPEKGPIMWQHYDMSLNVMEMSFVQHCIHNRVDYILKNPDRSV